MEANKDPSPKRFKYKEVRIGAHACERVSLRVPREGMLMSSGEIATDLYPGIRHRGVTYHCFDSVQYDYKQEYRWAHAMNLTTGEIVTLIIK